MYTQILPDLTPAVDLATLQLALISLTILIILFNGS